MGLLAAEFALDGRGHGGCIAGHFKIANAAAGAADFDGAFPIAVQLAIVEFLIWQARGERCVERE